MATTPKRLKLKQQLSKSSWSEFIKLFNAKHNPMMTSVGVVEVIIDEKENSNSKKS